MSDTAMGQIDSMLEKVRVQAAAELGWKGADMAIQSIDTLSQHGCQFFAIRHSRQTDGPVHGYAVLPDGSVLGRQPGRLERILAACGGSADALWWAGVISRYADAGGTLVTRQYTPLLAYEIAGKGHPDVTPTLTRSAKETMVRFYTHDAMRGQSHQVQATLAKDGHLHVSKSPV